MVKNVNRTARLQWKVDTIKNCKYLQCRKTPCGDMYPNMYLKLDDPKNVNYYATGRF